MEILFYLILAIVLYLYWHFYPQIEYINKSDMYIMWYNVKNNKRKYLILWQT